MKRRKDLAVQGHAGHSNEERTLENIRTAPSQLSIRCIEDRYTSDVVFRHIRVGPKVDSSIESPVSPGGPLSVSR